MFKLGDKVKILTNIYDEYYNFPSGSVGVISLAWGGDDAFNPEGYLTDRQGDYWINTGDSFVCVAPDMIRIVNDKQCDPES